MNKDTFEYLELLKNLISPNSATMLLNHLNDYARDSTQEFEINVYDRIDNTASRIVFQNFELYGLKCLDTTYSADVITQYVNPLGKYVRKIHDLDTGELKEVTIKNIIHHFKCINEEKNLNDYGMLFKFKLNEEIPIEDTKNVIYKFQLIRQRRSYFYENWRVDKSLRYSVQLPNKFDKGNFTEDNYNNLTKFNTIDIEIEHIGKHENIIEDFASLLNALFPKQILINDTIKSKYNFNELPKVITLSKQKFEKKLSRELDKYVWLYKTDGERVILLFFERSIYVYNTKFFKKLIYETEFDNLYVFDAEFYDEQDIFVFDTMIYEDMTIENMSYMDRLDRAKQFINFPSFIDGEKTISIQVKEYQEISNWLQLLNDLNSSRSIHLGDKNIKVDGIILQSKELPYKSKDGFAFKVKPRNLNTIDFQLMYCNSENRFLLFVSSNYKAANKELKRISYHNKFYRLFFNENNPMNRKSEGKTLLSIFSSPYCENASFIDYINIEDKSISMLFEEDQKDVNILLSDMRKNPFNYHKKIVECVYTDRWLPLKIRDDKRYPNTQYTASSNFDIVFNYYNTEEFAPYFNNNIIETEISKFFKYVNRIIRTYIFNKYINPICDVNPGISFLDLACGRGADIPRIIENGISNVFALDACKDALVEYKERFTNASRNPDTKSTKKINVLDTAVIPIPEHFSLNIVNYEISEKNITDIEKDIMIRSEYEQFDIVLFNFAIHYLLYDTRDLISLVELLSKIIKKNGKLIITYYDGDKISNNIKTFEKFKYLPITLVQPSSKPKKLTGGDKRSKSSGDKLIKKEYNYINWIKNAGKDKLLLNNFCIFYSMVKGISLYDVPKHMENKDLMQNGKNYGIPENVDVKISYELSNDGLTISDTQESIFVPIALVNKMLDMHVKNNAYDESEEGINDKFVQDLYVVSKHYYHCPEYGVDQKIIEDYARTFDIPFISNSFNYAGGEFYSLYENDELFGATRVIQNGKLLNINACCISSENGYLITYFAKHLREIILFSSNSTLIKEFEFSSSLNVKLENKLMNKLSKSCFISIKSEKISFDKIWSPLYRYAKKDISTLSAGAMLSGGDKTPSVIPMLANMPLITIDATGEREEPLVIESVLTSIFEPTFTEIHSEPPLMNVIDHIGIYDRLSLVTDEEYNEVTAYCDLITVKVYKLS